jgi:hypothetical protein
MAERDAPGAGDAPARSQGLEAAASPLLDHSTKRRLGTSSAFRFRNNGWTNGGERAHPLPVGVVLDRASISLCPQRGGARSSEDMNEQKGTTRTSVGRLSPNRPDCFPPDDQKLSPDEVGPGLPPLHPVCPAAYPLEKGYAADHANLTRNNRFFCVGRAGVAPPRAIFPCRMRNAKTIYLSFRVPHGFPRAQSGSPMRTKAAQ